MSATIIVIVIIIVFPCALFLTGFPLMNSRDSLSLALVHKSMRAVPPFCPPFFLLEPPVWHPVQCFAHACGPSAGGRVRLCPLTGTRFPILWACITSLLLITWEFKWLKMPLTSIPVGTAHIMLNTTLGPSEKALAAAKFQEAVCTQQIRWGKENCTRRDRWPCWLEFS